MGFQRSKTISELQSTVTGRDRSIFSDDFEHSRSAIANLYGGKSVLVAGAAGTIGRATIAQLIQFRPKAIWLLDINENGLADTIRWLRTSYSESSLPELFPRLGDVTTNLVYRGLRGECKPDVILNFSAVKHVRSERDPISILRMFQVNALGIRCLSEIAKESDASRIFSVSTDKAANPTNLMGASKRIMEAILLQDSDVFANSARFANVAFSQGSLLESWITRIQNGEPMPVPINTRRFFLISIEAGQLCLIASANLPSGSLTTPLTGSHLSSRDLLECAVSVAEMFGLEPIVNDNYDSWRNPDGTWMSTNGQQRILGTARDTEGEKEVEEFTESTDVTIPTLFTHIATVIPSPVDIEQLHSFEEWLCSVVSQGDTLPSKRDFLEAVERVLPTFNWQDARQILDNRL